MRHSRPVLVSLLTLASCEGDNSPCASWRPAEAAEVVVPTFPEGSPVARHGRLSVAEGSLRDAAGLPVQLRGVSNPGTLWHRWGRCNTDKSMAYLADLGVDVFRVVTYPVVDRSDWRDGDRAYETHPACYEDQVALFVNAASAQGMYSIIDWHVLGVDPNEHLAMAKEYWAHMSQAYAGRPDVLYEIANEPADTGWASIKRYAEVIIPIIRANDPDAIILVGTPGYSSELSGTSKDPIQGDNAHNIMYSYHFYAAGGEDYRPTTEEELLPYVGELPLFVTEWGPTETDGDGPLNYRNTSRYLEVLDEHQISWVTWSWSDTWRSSGLVDSCEDDRWSDKKLTEAGRLWRDALQDGR